MKSIQTNLEGVQVIIPDVLGDERGFFKEVIHPQKLADVGINHRFVQLNHSKSQQGTLRGLHFQLPPYEQSKLVRVLKGAIYDVAVDIRPNSPSFGQYFGIELTAENHKMLYVPIGFAHGFLALTDCDIEYACGDIYSPDFEASLRWDDPTVGVEWPTMNCPFLLSKKDKVAPFLSDISTMLN